MSVDPITLQVIQARLAGIVQEMQNSLFRTAFSPIIRESQDASCAILNCQGEVVPQHVVLPLHMGAFPACAEGILKSYPAAEIHEGDAFITNHPYLGGSPHAPDMAVLTPIFYRGEWVGFATNMAHKSDIGGTVPGSGAGQAREIYHDGIELDRPIRIHVAVEKKKDAIHFDFTGCGDQTKGPANIRPPLVRACCAYCLVCLVDPFLPINKALNRVVGATFREGSVVCPSFPAAVNTYMPTALVVAEALLQALGHFVPEKRIAEGSGSAAISLGGRGEGGARGYVQYEILAGGTGARSRRDGASATAFHLSNGKMAPIEIIESEFPTRVDRFELLADSGGAGFYRGGLGFVRDYRILADEVRFSMRTDKHLIAPEVKDGGKEGGKGACIINPGRNDERRLPSRFGDYMLRKADLLRLERPGGGGMGHSFSRHPEKVLNDACQGYVSIEKAISDYGVALRLENGNLILDRLKTQRLRALQK